MKNFILNIIAYILIFAFTIIPFIYYIILVRWTIKNKWQSSIFKSKFAVIFYFIFPPLAWYDAFIQMNKKRKHIGGCSSIIISFFILVFIDTLFTIMLKYKIPSYYIYFLFIIFLFLLPVCILFTSIIRRYSKRSIDKKSRL